MLKINVTKPGSEANTCPKHPMRVSAWLRDLIFCTARGGGRIRSPSHPRSRMNRWFVGYPACRQARRSRLSATGTFCPRRPQGRFARVFHVTGGMPSSRATREVEKDGAGERANDATKQGEMNRPRQPSAESVKRECRLLSASSGP